MHRVSLDPSIPHKEIEALQEELGHGVNIVTLREVCGLKIFNLDNYMFLMAGRTAFRRTV